MEVKLPTAPQKAPQTALKVSISKKTSCGLRDLERKNVLCQFGRSHALRNANYFYLAKHMRKNSFETIGVDHVLSHLRNVYVNISVF